MNAWKTIDHCNGEQTRAMEMPHGVLVLHEQWGDHASESMVFVPSVTLEPTCKATGLYKIVPR